MKTLLVENNGSERHIYDSVLLDPKKMKMLSNPLALKIVSMLGEEELCAIDIARKLKVHEQNVYYHLHNMEKAGIVHVARREMRYGMTAKMYAPVASVVAAKLYENGHVVENIKTQADPAFLNFLEPFIKNGKLNAKIVVGSPYPHGEFEATSRNGNEIISLSLFLGRFLDNFEFLDIKCDVNLDENDIKGNMIVLGGPRTNIMANRINDELPIYFNRKNSWQIVSKITGNVYDYDYDAVIERIKNPFNKRKEILLLAGKRSAGLASAVIAFTQHLPEIMNGNAKNNELICKVVTGIDKDADSFIDSVKFGE